MDDGSWVFHIGSCLGSGGFGEVYRAEMVSPYGLSTPVALKILRRDVCAPGAALARLWDEGRMLARLRHPSILTVHDLVVLEGRVALVTELVEGIDLERAIFGEPRIGPRAAAEALAQVASALATASEAPVGDGAQPLRLVHRDVKPSNIRVGRHGEVKLLDFGLGRSDAMSREARTRTDTVLGSPPYMAPERFLDEPVTPAADVYALGVIAAEVLSGQRLFSVALPVLAALSMDPARFRASLASRLSTLPPSAPPQLLELARRLLAFDPLSRPTAAQAAQLFEDLREHLPGPSLSRWCREQVEPVYADDRTQGGEFEGRQITASRHATPAERRRSVPPVEPTLAGVFPAPSHPAPSHPAPSRPGPVPSRPSSTGFFGRGEELAALVSAWYAGVRVLTVRGPAGVGKTRLLQEHLAALLSVQPDAPIVRVSLAGLTSRADLLEAVAAALEVPLVGSEEAWITSLGLALRHRGTSVLLLDNAEPISDIVAEVVSRWATEGLQILVTSRKVLQVEGERVLDLGPLPPEEALELLLDRARRVRWDYAPTTAERQLLQELAQTELDGLPLALEFAGARLDVLDAAELAEGLRRRQDLLSGGRQGSQWSSVRAALAASWTLLDGEQQRALARLGVFSTSFDRPAAEAVIGPAATEVLRTLVEHSLLQRDGSRFRLLAVVEEFAREQLVAMGEEALARQRHRQWYRQLVGPWLAVAETGAGLEVPSQLAERGNISAAHQGALQAGDADTAASLVCWLDRIAELRGPSPPRASLLERTLALLPAGHPSAIELGWRLGDALRLGGRFEQAEVVLWRVLEQARAISQAQTSGPWTALFKMFGMRNQRARVHEHLQEALAATRAAGEGHHEGTIWRAVYIVARLGGERERAWAAAREAARLYRESGNAQLQIVGLMLLAGDGFDLSEESLDYLVQALSLARSHRLTTLECDLLLHLGHLRLGRSELQAAVETFDRAEAQAARLGLVEMLWRSVSGRVAALVDLGRLLEASRSLEQLEHMPGADEPLRATHVSYAKGQVERLSGRTADAELSFRAAIHHAGRVGDGARRMEVLSKLQLAAALAELGRPDEAESVVAAVCPLCDDQPMADMLVIARAEVALARGQPLDGLEQALVPSPHLYAQRMQRMLERSRARS
jgi:serine/threonine protein kinase/predicted ATPase